MDRRAEHPGSCRLVRRPRALQKSRTFEHTRSAGPVVHGAAPPQQVWQRSPPCRDTLRRMHQSFVQVWTAAERPIPGRLVRDLYARVGWWPERSEKDIARVLVRGVAIAAWDDERLVGFARAVSDGRFRAYIEDVVVHEHYRRQGVAMDLLERLLDELGTIDVVSLFCDPRLAPLYERAGFEPTRQLVLHRERPSPETV